MAGVEIEAIPQVNARRSQLYANRPVSHWEAEEEVGEVQKPLTLNDYVAMFNLKTYFQARDNSATAWVLLVTLVFSFVVVLFVFVAPWWGRTREVRGFEGVFEGDMYGYYGLWYACWTLTELDPGYGNSRPDCELIADLRFIPDWFQGCQAMAVFLLLSGLGAIVFASMYVCAQRYNKNPSIITTVIFFCVAAALFDVVLFVVFAVQFLKETKWCCASGVMEVIDYHLYICFIIACTLPAFYMTAAVVASIEVSSLRREVKKEKYLQHVANTRRGYPGSRY